MLALILAIVLAIILASGVIAYAQATAFSYQGRLSDSGSAANGNYDFQFKLYDGVSAGVQQGSMLSASNVPVANGIFTVVLDFGAGAFPGPARFLEIAAKPSAGVTYITLSPRQPIASMPYAIRSLQAGAADGLSVACLNCVTSSQVAPLPNYIQNTTSPQGAANFNISGNGTVGGTLSANAVSTGTLTGATVLANTLNVTGALNVPGPAIVASLNAGGQSGVGAGGLVLSATENTALVSAGYVRIGSTVLPETWTTRSNAAAPSGRTNHSAVWTGSEMIVWGGFNGAYLNDGGRYNFVANSWTALSTTGAPAARGLHTALWTGTDMIVWGGQNAAALGDGGRYNPATNTWTAVAAANAPTPRANHAAVWTGSEMIVWGGLLNGLTFNTGGRYNPATDSWTASSTAGAPAARANHAAVWTGSEMIVWGGAGTNYFNDGGRYNVAGDTWTGVSTTGAPAARSSPTAVWTGTEMIVWGGATFAAYFNSGGRYSPASNTWTALPAAGAPAGRSGHSAVWTGTEMIVWGGVNGTSFNAVYLNDGSRFSPSSNAWTVLAAAGAPSARAGHGAAWTGSEMLVWGGGNGNYLNDIFSLTPGRVMQLYSRQ